MTVCISSKPTRSKGLGFVTQGTTEISRPADTPGGSPRLDAVLRVLRPEYIFLVLALVTGIFVSVFLPAGAGLDEPFHVARVEQVARGQVFPVLIAYSEDYPSETAEEKQTAALYGGTVDRNLYEIAFKNCVDYQVYGHDYPFPCWTDSDAGADARYGANGTTTTTFSNASVNTPVTYAPYIVGFWLSRFLAPSAYWMIVVMRLCGLALFAGLVFLAIRIVPVGKYALAFLACTPNMVSSISCVSADTVTNALGFLFVALVLRLALAKRDEEIDLFPRLVGLGVVALCLSVSKMVFASLLLLLPLLLFMGPVSKSLKARAAVFATGILGICLFFAWYSVIKSINTGAMWFANIYPSQQTSYVLSHPAEFLQSLANTLATADVFQLETYGVGDQSRRFEDLPIVISLAVLVLSLLARDPREVRKVDAGQCAPLVAVSVAVAAICFVLSCLALYLSYSTVGAAEIDGMQARYYLISAALIATSICMVARCAAPRLLAGKAPALVVVALALVASCAQHAAFVIEFVSTV